MMKGVTSVLSRVTTSFAPVTIGEQAEDLIRTLPGVVSVRVVGGDDNSVREVHILTTSEVSAKQTVRNVESALFAHLGVRIDHRRISVAAASETPAPLSMPPAAPPQVPQTSAPSGGVGAQSSSMSSAPRSSASRGPILDADDDYASRSGRPAEHRRDPGRESTETNVNVSSESFVIRPSGRRRLYFEDVEVRGSRTRGVSCRVTLAKDGASYVGEARGVDGDRARLELAARAACLAIGDADGRDRQFGLEGVRIFEAFERKFVFVGVTVRYGREARLLSGTCEVIDSAETAAVLAVLDATNRWIEYGV